MAQQNSFDIVSQVDRAEITNAINQTIKAVYELSLKLDKNIPYANYAQLQ